MSIVKLLTKKLLMPYFHNSVKETLCINWKRQCAKRELLDALGRTLGGITKCNVICFHTNNGLIIVRPSPKSKVKF